MVLEGLGKGGMAAALNPKQTDFSMSPGLSTHVVYVWGHYGPVISGGVIHFKLPSLQLE